MINKKQNQELENMRHSLAHLLAAAVLELWPDTKPAIGPSIENGFYYDFDFTRPISDSDLPKIEKKMREILPSWDKFEKIPETVDSAQNKYSKNQYKSTLIQEIAKKGENITSYKSGNFEDLCHGDHVKSSKEIKPDAFTLTHIAGAYWQGDEKNKMLTRIYGAAFKTKKELNAYLAQIEEAKKRDHRKLGKELDLFVFSNLVGSGLPLFTPKGTTIRNELQKAVTEISKKYGAKPVTTPHIAKRKLYEISGHAEKFGDELLKVKGHHEDFVVKPVNCPHHIQIYASQPHSYRDLPVSYIETTAQYRDEKPGEIGGLTRVRAITVDDGHIFCTIDQIKDEAKKIIKIIQEFYKGLNMWENHWVSLSVRDPETPDAYLGDKKDWDKAEKMLQDISCELKLDAKRVEGEAAIYGPKIDFIFRDSLGREWQLATVQLDFAMPKRFGLTYTDEKGGKTTPVMMHRAILGSYERFMAILIEHYAGAFPVWLSPVQVWVLPISDKFNTYGEKTIEQLKEVGVRAELRDETESLGKKIRSGELQKIPYILIIGEKEKTAETVSVRSREKGDIGAMKLNKFIKKITEEIKDRK